MSNYLDLIRDAQTERQVDMVVEDILSAIASICDALDKGEMVEHVAKRKGLSPAKVRNIYRVRNRRKLCRSEKCHSF